MYTTAYSRGDVIIVDFGNNVGTERNGLRPAVVLSPRFLNAQRDHLIVAPMGRASHRLTPQGNYQVGQHKIYVSSSYHLHQFLKEDSIINLEQLRSISRDRVRGYLGQVSPAIRHDIHYQLHRLLFMEE